MTIFNTRVLIEQYVFEKPKAKKYRLYMRKWWNPFYKYVGSFDTLKDCYDFLNDIVDGGWNLVDVVDV